MSDHDTPILDGLFKVRLQLRDDDGRVTETIEASEHRCTAITCEEAAHCETCGGTGSTRILLIGSTDDGMDIFVCYPCLVGDSYCQTEKDPSRCPNSWHRMNELTALRPCPECPARISEASDGTQYQEVDGRVMKRLPFASGWSLLDH